MIKKPENIVIPKKQAEMGHRFIYVPLCRQDSEYTCGAACVQSILAMYGMDYNQDVLAEKLQSKPVLGTDYRDILCFMQHLGFEASLSENMSVGRLKSFIESGITPMLILQAWKGSSIDYASDFKDGHYVIACGYTKDKILFMDPYTLGNYTYIPKFELMERWHVMDNFGRCYYRSALIIRKDHILPEYDPLLVEYMK